MQEVAFEILFQLNVIPDAPPVWEVNTPLGPEALIQARPKILRPPGPGVGETEGETLGLGEVTAGQLLITKVFIVEWEFTVLSLPPPYEVMVNVLFVKFVVVNEFVVGLPNLVDVPVPA